jgi:hypothetical protein
MTSLQVFKIVGSLKMGGYSFARGFARVILDRVQDNLDQAPGSRNWGIELDADAEFNFFNPPTAGRGRC